MRGSDERLKALPPGQLRAMGAEIRRGEAGASEAGGLVTGRYRFAQTLRSTDANHAEILKAARDLGFEVVDTHTIGRGVPDAVVIRPSDQRAWLVEIKVAEGELTPAEERYVLRSKTPVAIVRTVDELLKLLQV